MGPSSHRPVLRDLPFAARLVIATFLVSVGVGYCSALVQLHFQGGTKPGEALPGPNEAINTYHGPTGQPMSPIERLLESTDGAFNGSGTMRPAFFDKSSGWKSAVKGKDAAQLHALLKEREGELLALLDWARAG